MPVRDVLWDNGADDGTGAGLSSQLALNYPFNSQVADDFILATSANIESVHFWGVFWNGVDTNPIEVKILFYNDDGSGTQPVGAGSPDPTSYAFSVSDLNVTGTLVGTMRYEYDATLPTPVSVDAGVHYWMAIQAVIGFPPQWGWVTNGANPDQLSVAVQGFPLLGTPYWTPLTAYGDMAFSLSGSTGPLPADDVKVVSIDQPSSGPAASVFTPQITVKNAGTNNEDFPLEYTITRPGVPQQQTLFSTGFEDWTAYSHPGWTVGSYYNPSGIVWQGAGANTGFPSRSPHSGSEMAYYNSYDTWYNGEDSYMISTTLITPGAGTTTMTAWMYHFNGYYYNPPGSNVIPIISPDGVSLYYAGQSGDTWYTYDSSLPSYTGAWEQHSVDLTWATSYFPGGYFIGFFVTGDWWLDVSLDDVAVTGTVISPPIVEYDQTVSLTLAAGQTQAVTMPNWAPQGWQNVESTAVTYNSVATATLANDTNQGNNVLNKAFTLNYPLFHDIQADAILSPITGGLAQSYPVSMQISNQGQFPERQFWVDCQISQLTTGAALMDQTFDSGCPPAGWSASTSNWMVSYTNYAGGTPPEAEFNWAYNYGSVITSRLISNPIDTTGVTSGTLSFLHYVNDYNGQYTLEVQTTTDGGATWNTVWSTPGGALSGLVQVPIGAAAGMGSPTLQIAWVYYGDPFNINYWYVDNCQLVSAGQLPPEYDQVVGISEWLQPGASTVLTFPDWTPANLISPQTSGVIKYIAQGTTLLPGDENAANNVTTVPQVALTYIHDVTVEKITAPGGKGGEVIFSQFPYGGTDAWQAYTSGIFGNYNYVCMDDFTGLSSAIGGIEVFGLDLIYNAGWSQGDPTGAAFEIKFYTDNSGAPGSVVATFSNLQATSTVIYDNYAGYNGYHWTFALPSSVSLDTGWVSVQSTSIPDGSTLLWMDSPTGNNNALQNGAPISANLAFNLTAQSEIYVKQGASSPVAGKVNNPGTFEQDGLTCYANITDPSGNTTYQNSVGGINLAPLGAEQAVSFPSITFADEGTYTLTMSLPLSNDDKPTNNVQTLKIGSDGTPPVTTITTSPAAPNGANGWYVSNVAFTLKATDAMSGVASIWYTIDGGTAQPYTGGSVTISSEGNHTVGYYAIDKVGNQEAAHTLKVNIDKTLPYIILNKDILLTKIKYTAVVQDNMSGMDRVEFWIGPYLQFVGTCNASGSQSVVWILSPVPHINVTITAKAYDLAGNMAFAQAGPLNLPASQSQKVHSQTEK